MTTHDAIKHLSHKIAFAKECDTAYAGGIHIEALEIAVRAMADVRKTGCWKMVQRDRWIYAKCSICVNISNTRTPYCAYCGARMEANYDNS